MGHPAWKSRPGRWATGYRSVAAWPSRPNAISSRTGWEAILFAPQHELDNLTVVVDYNKIQSFGRVKDILDLEPLAEKWRAFRWAVQVIDGHDHAQIEAALTRVSFEPGKPGVVIAHTIKGKGVSFMENQLAWHYKSPNAEQLAQALAELGSVP
jgi:transketolase